VDEASGIRIRWARVAEGAPRRDTAWGLLRSLLPDDGTRITNECDRCGEPHGRVRIHDPRIRSGVTYAGGFAIVCVTDEAASVGIDAEPEFDARRDAAGLVGIVRSGVTTTVRAWTRIEAVLKADGRGLQVDPSRVHIAELGGGTWRASIDGSATVFAGRDVAGPDRVMVSVAVQPLSRVEGQEARPDPATP